MFTEPISSDVGWLPGQPTLDTTRNCAYLSYYFQGVTQTTCQDEKDNVINCGCMVPVQHYNPKIVTPLYMTLRGLCAETNLDTLYYPLNWEDSYFGYSGYR